VVRLWKSLLAFTVTRPLVAILGLFLAGILFWGAFNTTLEITNREAFCISCHEMRDNVYREYRETVHFSNRTGVRATCPDCHVPKEWHHMVVRKIQATNELYHWLRGTIDTREKFVAKRLDLARTVWANMAATDSRECRNCHSFAFMDTDAQQPGAGAQHVRGQNEGKTCIDCHVGIAHRLPEEFIEAEHDRFEREQVPCSDCHSGMARAPSGDDWAEDEDGGEAGAQ
jgi:cytochrome c-type protein NapC